MNPLICRAITTRTMLAFDYDRQHRVVEPHCHGHAPDGRELLRAFQIAGASASGRPLGWRLYEVRRISELRSVNEHFVPRSDFDPTYDDMRPIHCAV